MACDVRLRGVSIRRNQVTEAVDASAVERQLAALDALGLWAKTHGDDVAARPS